MRWTDVPVRALWVGRLESVRTRAFDNVDEQPRIEDDLQHASVIGCVSLRLETYDREVSEDWTSLRTAIDIRVVVLTYRTRRRVVREHWPAIVSQSQGIRPRL